MSLENPAIVASENGVEIARMPELTCELPGGLIGHYQRDFDDCARAAVATVLELPYEEIPRLDTSSAPVEFAFERGLRIVPHYLHLTDHPAAPPEGLWVLTGRHPDYSDGHAVVARGREVIHDPSSGWHEPDGSKLPQPAWEFEGGYSFEKRN